VDGWVNYRRPFPEGASSEGMAHEPPGTTHGSLTRVASTTKEVGQSINTSWIWTFSPVRPSPWRTFPLSRCQSLVCLNFERLTTLRLHVL